MEVTQKQLEALTERIARKLPKQVGQASENIILNDLVAFCETIDPDLESIDAEEIVWCVRKLAEISSRTHYPLLEASERYDTNICSGGSHDFIPMTAEEAYLGREMNAEDKQQQIKLGTTAYIEHLKTLATVTEPLQKLGSEAYMGYFRKLAAVKE